jgi:hypothetical protein
MRQVEVESLRSDIETARDMGDDHAAPVLQRLAMLRRRAVLDRAYDEFLEHVEQHVRRRDWASALARCDEELRHIRRAIRWWKTVPLLVAIVPTAAFLAYMFAGLAGWTGPPAAVVTEASPACRTSLRAALEAIARDFSFGTPVPEPAVDELVSGGATELQFRFADVRYTLNIRMALEDGVCAVYFYSYSRSRPGNSSSNLASVTVPVPDCRCR